MERTINIFRILFVTACGVGGYYVAEAFTDWLGKPLGWAYWPHWGGFFPGMAAGRWWAIAGATL